MDEEFKITISNCDSTRQLEREAVLGHALAPWEECPDVTPSASGNLGDTHFFIRAVDLAQGIADLADRAIRLHAIDDEGHGVRVGHLVIGFYDRLLRGGALEGVESAADGGRVAPVA